MTKKATPVLTETSTMGDDHQRLIVLHAEDQVELALARKREQAEEALCVARAHRLLTASELCILLLQRAAEIESAGQQISQFLVEQANQLAGPDSGVEKLHSTIRATTMARRVDPTALPLDHVTTIPPAIEEVSIPEPVADHLASSTNGKSRPARKKNPSTQ